TRLIHRSLGHVAAALAELTQARRPHRFATAWLALALLGLLSASLPGLARAQSPELAMRDFSSGQIKKGVRSIGFGGDGATWGNYSLVWKDAGTALADYGDTSYTNDNDFHFVALGATTPSLWHGLAIYVIAMTEHTNNIQLSLKAFGFGNAPVPMVGNGTDDAVFAKIAMPLGHGISAGILLSHETSHFDATSVAAPPQGVQYSTAWRPSGGLGVSWQPSKTVLFGFRVLLNNDRETRADPAGTSEGLARSYEFRLGGSLIPWEGALIDLGGTRLEKRNTIAGTHTITYEPNVGFEQAFAQRHLTLRVGVDETSPTAGATIRFAPLNVDIAYVRNMARARVGELFGDQSNSVLVTVTVDYEALWKGR
ncbi:MAG TPA: hypothetical protein VGY54_12610, partial [Polyangiaceae bacterium]|nr:hypothetical protein [Polyangiaceae bacterium]